MKSLWGKPTQVMLWLPATCYLGSRRYEIFRQLESASYLKARVLMCDLNQFDVYWKSSTSNPRGFCNTLMVTVTQVTEELDEGRCSSGPCITNKNELIGTVIVTGSLAYCDCEMVKFRILRRGNKADGRITILDFSE